MNKVELNGHGADMCDKGPWLVWSCVKKVHGADMCDKKFSTDHFKILTCFFKSWSNSTCLAISFPS